MNNRYWYVSYHWVRESPSVFFKDTNGFAASYMTSGPEGFNPHEGTQVLREVLGVHAVVIMFFQEMEALPTPTSNGQKPQLKVVKDDA